MKVLSNLLTVLAALFNLASGCGLRGTGAGKGLVQIGNRLANRHIGALSTGAALAAVNTVLSRHSGGSLLGGISTIQRGALGGGLTSGGSALGTSGANSGLQASLGVLGARLQGGSGGSLLAGIEKAALTHLRGGDSSGNLGSVSSTGISGGNSAMLLGHGVQQSAQRIAGGFLLAATSSTSSATGVGVRTGGNPPGSTVGLVAPQGGSRPIISGPGSGLPGPVGSLPGATPEVGAPGALGVLPGSGVLGGVSSTSSLSTSSVSVTGANVVQPLGQTLPQTNPTLSAASLGAGGVAVNNAVYSATNLARQTAGSILGVTRNINTGGPDGGIPSGGNGLAPSTVGSGLGALPGGVPAVGVVGSPVPDAVQLGGPRGDSVPSSTNPGSGPVLHPGSSVVQGLQQSTNQIGQMVNGGLIGSGTALLQPAARMGSQVTVSSAQSILRVTSGGTSGVPSAGAPSGNIRQGLSGGDSEPALQPGNNVVQGLQQGTNEIGQVVNGAIIGGNTAALQPAAGMGTRLAVSSAQNILSVASGGNDAVPSGGVPSGSIRQGPSGGDSVPAGLPGSTSLEQRPNQIGQGLHVTNIRTTSTTQQSATRLGIHLSGSSPQNIPNMPSRIGGGVPQQGPNDAGPGTGLLRHSNIVQRLGQGINQIDQTLPGAIIGGGATALQSTANMATQMASRSTQSAFGVASRVTHGISGIGALSGGSQSVPSVAAPGINPGQQPGQGSQPIGHVSGGQSFMSVSTSSHSERRWGTHIVGNSQGGGLTNPGSGGPGGASLPGTSGLGATGAGSGLYGTILGAATGQGLPAGPGALPADSMGGHSSSSVRVSSSSSSISGIAPHRPQHRIGKPSAAAVAGIALGTMAGAVALTALGTGLASAIQAGTGGGRRHVGCSRGGCSSGCGRKRRSVAQSKVPAEVLNSIPMDFNRRY